MRLHIFRLRDEHLKLMRRLTIQSTIYSPYGTYLTPEIDPKRPYGNSDVLGDVAEVCGFVPDSETGEYSADDAQKAAIIVAELPIAIKLALTAQKPLEPGYYALDRDGDLSCEIFRSGIACAYALQYKALKEAQDAGVIPSIRDDDRVYQMAHNCIGESDPFLGVMIVLKQAEYNEEQPAQEKEKGKKLLEIYNRHHEEYLHTVYSPDNAITSFTDVDGDNFFLSNFYNSSVFDADGVEYRNVEAAFQAQKTMDIAEREKFRELVAKDAKSLGRKVRLRKDWERVKDTVMLDLLRRKFGNHPDLRKRLIATGDKLLVEGNWWHDNYWGNCTCPLCRTKIGENKLGKMLMVVRDELARDGGGANM